MKLLLKFVNLLLFLFWLSYVLDAWWQRKIVKDKIEFLIKSGYYGRGAPSGNYYMLIQTSGFSFHTPFKEQNNIKKGDTIILRLTPIYKIVDSYCTQPGPGTENCLNDEDTPYRQPFYTLLITVLILFILYTLLFEKEMRFLKRLTLGNTIATIIFAFIFLFLFVL